MKDKQERNRKFLIRLFLLVTAVIIIILLLRACGNKTADTMSGVRESDALLGSLNTMTEEELQAELNRIVEEGMFRISIASTIIAGEDGRAEVRIENNRTNRYLMQVAILLDQNGEEIYRTDLIDPGYYIKDTWLDKKLPGGEYEATAVFTALDPETEGEVGRVNAKVRIVVLKQGDTVVE